MCYIIFMLELVCCLWLPLTVSSGTGSTVWRRTAGWKSDVRFPDDTRHVTVLVQRTQTTVPDKKEPPSATQDTAAGAEGKNKDAPRQKDTSPAPKDFVPSEKIDADKAVDFPVDI